MSVRNRSFFCILVILFVSSIFFGSCVTPKDEGRYYNKDLGFSIRFPEGWEVGIFDEGYTVSATCPIESATDMFDEMVTVSAIDYDGNLSLEAFHNENIQITENSIDNFNIEDGGDVTFNNIKAKWIIFTYSTPREEVKVLGYSIVKGSRGYLITCDTEPSSFDDYYEILRSSAESFKFE